MNMSMVSMELSSRIAPMKAKASTRVAAKARVPAVCAANGVKDAAGKAAATLALAAIFAAGVPAEAMAKEVTPYAGLTPCASNAGFAKRQKQEIKVLEKRLKQYEADSAPALALNATIAKTKTRFANYGAQGLLCGKDGLPHLIVDGSLQHLGEFTYPGIGFLYVAGWIGYAGRSYVIKNKTTEKPTNGEIIIDVPLALNLMFAAGAWPLLALREAQAGTLFADDADITVSPR